MKSLVILGSTGSIGTQALEVCRSNGYKVVALAAGSNVEVLEAQAREFKVKAVAVFNEEKANELKIKLSDTDIKVLSGVKGVCEVAEMEADIALNSIVGIAGLRPTLAAIESGKDIALANKETLVTGGDIVNRKAREKGVKILPVDSEHSAIFQSLQGAPKGSLKKILLTASGGPFFGKTRSDLENVTVREALAHPNWSMGAKITIDSATLMNKGLEVIEAVHLFGVSANDIEVLVHRQSILHSAVELSDGAVIGQLGTPDMRLPIQYALTYPERSNYAFEKLSLADIGTLTFQKPDTDTFRCLPLCISAINEGGLRPTAVNGANEEAVRLFLEGKINFLQIAELVEKAACSAPNKKDFNLEDILYTDKAARQAVLNNI
ncbi:MAG: 1-deoxy-D-xylulose-5-phosphate reductoisomerase [Clostridia bacterium]|nr:1-deoxy-D-xylulose-5-phosphate reductoisomerase [Clostridia bacterium]MBO5358759.1 1-deoxy-D-xylulose-5-phosphate reductoisomerase [Clostridia bacterium]